MIAPHHQAWLDKHPERTSAWLFDMIAQGFDIHHVDGNHGNNVPENVVLIEHVDHLGLHGLFPRVFRPGSMHQTDRTQTLGERAYKLTMEGLSFSEVAERIYGNKRMTANANSLANAYARNRGLPKWPDRTRRAKPVT